MTRKIALIGCGAAKNPGKLPAKDKYSSNYFGLKWDYGDVVCDEQCIISAKYGLLKPDQVINDYNVSITDLSDTNLEYWARDVNAELSVVVDRNSVDEVHILMGSKYIEPLEEYFIEIEERGVDLVYPFEGTSGIGEQMSQLKKLTQAERASQ